MIRALVLVSLFLSLPTIAAPSDRPGRLLRGAREAADARVRPVVPPGSQNAMPAGTPERWLLIEKTTPDLGEVVAGEQKIELSALVVRVFSTEGWRLVASAMSGGRGAGRLSWRTDRQGEFVSFPEGAPIEIATGEGAAATGLPVQIDFKLETGESSGVGLAEFLIDLRLEHP